MSPTRALHGPLLVVNFKAYIEATGKRAIQLAKTAARISRDTGVLIIVAPQFTDIEPVSENADVIVFSQHLDPVKPGAYTGHVVAEALKSAGAEGSLLNHSEKRLSISDIRMGVKMCGETDLYSLVCADTAQMSADVAKEKPNMIAIEPPDLIGSGVSVSKARPGLITESLAKIRGVNSKVQVLCGAGVTTADDVSKALQLGAEGVLVASSVVKSNDPSSVLASMADAIADAGRRAA